MITMRGVFLVLLLAIGSTLAHAQCINTVDMNHGDVGGYVYVVLDARASCGQTTTVDKGDAVKITAGGKQVSGTIAKITIIDVDPVHQKLLAVAVGGPAAEDAATLEQFPNGPGAKVSYNGTTVDATVANGAAINTRRYNWAVGPAKEGDNSDSTTAADAPATSTTMRFQYDGEFIQEGFFGHATGKSDTQKQAKYETHATLSVDTTSSNKSTFIDNNVATLGLRSLQREFGGLKQVHFGFEGQLSKAAHQDVHDGAATATLSAWVPQVPSITILSSVPDYIAPPLTLDLSYGYKNMQTATASMHGTGGTGTAAYRLYVMDKYEVAASETWTLNNFSDRAADVPRTQRMFKVQISYLKDPATGFAVAASYEDGSIGPVLTKVKQYFLGIALSKFSLSGTSAVK